MKMIMTLLFLLLFLAVVIYSIYAFARVSFLILTNKRSAIRIAEVPFFLISVVFIVWGIGNLVGFSWKRLQWVSEKEIVQAGIEQEYRDYFRSEADIKKEYPDFKISVSYWKGWLWEFEPSVLAKFLGYTYYQVRLPTAIALVDVDGVGAATRSEDCESSSCKKTPTATREFGFIGVLVNHQNEMEDVHISNVKWAGIPPTDTRLTWNGNCINVYAKNAAEATLIVSADGYKPVEINGSYGFYAGVLRARPNDFNRGWWSGPSLKRLHPAQFPAAKCSDEQLQEMRQQSAANNSLQARRP